MQMLYTGKHKKCIKCKNLVDSKFVPGYGCLNADIMFVGLAPGRLGAGYTGVPFTQDASGCLFQRGLINSGLSNEKDDDVIKPVLKDVYVTNLVKCNPYKKIGRDNKINRDPNDDEINNCYPYLEHEIKSVNPKIVVMLGKIVTKYVLEKKTDTRFKNNDKFLGFCEDHSDGFDGNDDIRYIPFIHPGFVVRGAYKKMGGRDKYLKDFSQIKNVLHEI